MDNKILLIKSSYNSFDSYINKLMIDTNSCSICTDLFTENISIKYLFSLFNKIIKIKKSKYENIIIIEEIKMAKLLRFLLNKKINIFFLNTIEKRDYDCINKLKNDFNLWTFDKGDAYKFNMNLTQQFFFKNINKNAKNSNKYDVYFVGEDKGRYSQLLNIANYLNDNSVSFKFNVIKDKVTKYQDNKYNILIDEFISYEKVIDNVSKSKVILELVKENQYGLTYRTMEAIFLDKKLITNNIEIKKESFYDPNKIFVIENDNYNNMIEFINSKDITYDNKTKEYYSFENWLNNFTK